MISERMGILERWVEYFDEPLNNQNIFELEVPPTEDGRQMLPPPSMEETVRAIYLYADGITGELDECGGDQLHQSIHPMLKVWTTSIEALSVSYIKRGMSAVQEL